MVIYLEEAVARKKAATGTLSVKGLHEAVMEGALLRLRPKVMRSGNQSMHCGVLGLLPI
jgi:Cu(I)/Ag(I) efflux system membrane protein CusA/SilA